MTKELVRRSTKSTAVEGENSYNHFFPEKNSSSQIILSSCKLDISSKIDKQSPGI